MSLDLSIELKSDGDISIFHIKGELDDFHASKLNASFAEAIDTNNAKKLIIDLDSADFIDSVGLGTIAIAAKKIASKNGKIAIVCSKPQIQKLIEASGITSAMSDVIAIYDSLDSGKASLA